MATKMIAAAAVGFLFPSVLAADSCTDGTCNSMLEEDDEVAALQMRYDPASGESTAPLHAMIEGYKTALVRNNATECASFFADDGYILPNDGATVHGSHADIVTFYENLFGYLVFSETVVEESMTISNDYLSGNVGSLTTLNIGTICDAYASDRGSWFFKKVGDEWKVTLMMLNFAASYPPMTPCGPAVQQSSLTQAKKAHKSKKQPPAQQVKQQKPAGETDAMAVIQAYGKALNAGDVAAVMECFDANAQLLPRDMPPSVGTENITAFYTGFLGAFNVDLQFTVDHSEVDGDVATVLSSSAGKICDLPDTNREAWGLIKQGGKWLINTYQFNKDAAPEGTLTPCK